VLDLERVDAAGDEHVPPVGRGMITGRRSRIEFEVAGLNAGPASRTASSCLDRGLATAPQGPNPDA
jgi:hypothetical protein